mgnify:CR=1 FL=1
MNLMTNKALALLLIATFGVAMPACKKTEGCTDPAATNYDPSADKDCCCEYAPTPTPSNTVNVNANITNNTTWTSSKKYVLYGFVEVEAGVTLTIEPGTIITGDKDTKGTLIVNRGAVIMAEGTSTDPIVFTSNQPAGQRAPGDWGGLILCGKAPVNLPGGVGIVEGGVEAPFGGSDAADNSGKLRYVRIEFSGIPFQPNQEINGLTLAGVGSGTTIDHIQVSYNGDDSYEFFGGTVNVKNLVALASWDDDFDMDNGFSGKCQFLVSLRNPDLADQSGSNGLEHDNDGQGTTATPYTTPVLSNVSIFGPQATPGTVINTNFKRSGHLRRNTHTRVYNSVFAGFPTGLLVDGSSCETNADAGELKVTRCAYAAMGSLLAVASGSTWDIQTWFDNGGNMSYADNAALGVADPFNLTSPSFVLNGGSPLAAGASFGEADLSDPFFEQVSYKGAFGSDNWTSGWCNWDPQNTPY